MNTKNPKDVHPQGFNVKGYQSEISNKDTQFYFENPQRQRLFELFLSGGQYSVVQLTVNCRIPDPRSHIRYLRNSGVPISDYWQKSEYSKHKIYFIHSGEATNPQISRHEKE